MKRWIVAAAMLLGIGASASHADYVIIVAKIGGKRDHGTAPGTPPGSPPGQIPPGGPQGGGPQGGGDIPTLGGAGGQTSANIDTNAVHVVTVVEAKAMPRLPGQKGTSVKTKWSEGKGVTRLFNDADSLQAFLLPAKSPRRRFNENRELAFKNRTPDKVFDLADWCLTHGMTDEFAKLMDDLVSTKEDQSSSSNERLKAAVKAYIAVKANLAKPIDSDSATPFWRSRLQARVETSPHYSLIYNATVANPPEVQERLKMLEEHMKAFYYWFALKGVALPMPKEKLVCVLIDSPDEFLKQRAVAEDEPLVSDGFYAARDHIVVFSTQRVDTPYKMFSRVTQPIWQQGLNKQGLLDGTEKRKPTIDPDNWSRFQTYALLEKGLEVEGDRAAVSHEGSRQLLVATGVMPRSVVPPQWAAFGTAATFETPKGPFPSAPLEASVAWFPGCGTPSWAYLRTFREWEQNGRFGEPAALMTEVVTDALFNRVLGAKDRAGLLRARTTAWALGFYLMKERLPGMMRYCQELSALPRDLEVDSRTLLACFCRAFDVANSTQDGPDPEKFAELARNWVAYMKGLQAPGAEFGLDQRQHGGDPNNPNQPGGPAGGRPSGPGGDSPGGGPGGGGPGGGDPPGKTPPPGKPPGGRG